MVQPKPFCSGYSPPPPPCSAPSASYFSTTTFGIVTGGGTLTIIDDDCVAHVYETGESFVAPVNPHTARNFSNAPVTVRATFFLSHAREPNPPTPPTVFVSPGDDNVLDAYCGLVD